MFPAAGPSLDQIVNAEPMLSNPALLTPIDVVGVAQVQLSTPIIEIDHGSNRQITVRTQAMIRYFREGNSRELPEFMRGEIRTTVEVDRVATQVLDVLDVNLKAATTKIEFVPTSPAPGAPEFQVHRAAINKASTEE